VGSLSSDKNFIEDLECAETRCVTPGALDIDWGMTAIATTNLKAISFFYSLPKLLFFFFFIFAFLYSLVSLPVSLQPLENGMERKTSCRYSERLSGQFGLFRPQSEV